MSAPINVFRTITARLTPDTWVPGGPDDPTGVEQTIYQAPPNITAIVLMAQLSNNREVSPINPLAPTTPDPHNVRVSMGVEQISILGTISPRFLVRNFLVSPSSAADLLSGKLIVEENESLIAIIDNGGEPPSPDPGIDLILSVIEARNA